MWTLYLLECQHGTGLAYYAGITTDIARRFDEHLNGTGARFTRANRPLRVVATRLYPDRASASRAEAALKKLSRARKPAYFD